MKSHCLVLCLGSVIVALVSFRTSAHRITKSKAVEGDDFLVRTSTLNAREGETGAVLRDVEKESEGISKDCNDWYGYAMLDKWQHTSLDLCRPGSASGTSRAHCLGRTKFDGHKIACVFENTKLLDFQPDYYTEPKVAHHHMTLALQGCERVPYKQGIEFSNWERPTAQNFRVMESMTCTDYVDHPVLAYSFWEPGLPNFYEGFHDVLSLFETVLALRWSFEDVELLATNLVVTMNIFPLYEVVRQAFGKRGIRYAHEWFKNGTCFRQLALPPAPWDSTLTTRRGRSGFTQCKMPIILGIRNFMGRMLKAHVDSSADCGLVLMHRGGTGPRTMDSERMIRALSSLLVNRSSMSGFQAFVYDPVGKPLAKGIKVMANAAVLFGIHGAGLTHSLFLSRGASLLEIFCGDRDSSNGHYRTIAAAVGARHIDYSAGGSCDTVDYSEVAELGLKNIPPPSVKLQCRSRGGLV
eukprot:TRINITY_DN13413_c0_g1_i3.p1 TRINITY_DN13413_c0_g1~~TRINITY_DN13413_c0_g1_i3.p1  ORF type:complete len:467 (-),score=32.49 TRINITY_DN13413_c0_g1_i3:51-1451(-)